MKSPTFIYHGDGRAIIVDRCDVAAKHTEGWRESPAEAAACTPCDTTREALELKAAALGVKVDGRWGDARLIAEIEKAT